MLILLSPAKTLRPSLPPAGPSLPVLSEPDATAQAKQIMEALSKWSREELAVKMSLSESLTSKVHEWHQKWTLDSPHAAGLTFHGDAFKSLDLSSLSAPFMAEAQRRVRILHAVYGLLRPWDAYSPVRLEMGQSWSPDPAFGSMHSYWKDVLPSLVHTHMKAHGHGHILNLASAEYSQDRLAGHGEGTHHHVPIFGRAQWQPSKHLRICQSGARGHGKICPSRENPQQRKTATIPRTWLRVQCRKK